MKAHLILSPVRQFKGPKLFRYLSVRALTSRLEWLGCIAGFIVFFAAPEKAFAAPLENGLLLATDAAGSHLFLMNPGTSLPKDFTFGLAQLNSTATPSFIRNPDGTETKTRTRMNAQGIAILAPFGSGLAAGLGAEFSRQEARSTNSNSNYRILPVEEQKIRRTLTGRVVFEFTPAFQVGAQFRYQSVNADLLGSFSADPADRTSYKGALFGGGAGGVYRMGSGALALSYFTPLRGKVTVTGESKVTSEPGMILVQAHLESSKALRFGVSYATWTYEKDELTKISTSPSLIRRTNIFLYGVSPEASLYTTKSLGLGAESKWGEALIGRISLFRDTLEFVVPEGIPGAVAQGSTSSRVFTGYHARSALALAQGPFETSFGVSYAQRKNTRAGDNGTSEDYKGEDLGTFATVRLNF